MFETPKPPVLKLFQILKASTKMAILLKTQNEELQALGPCRTKNVRNTEIVDPSFSSPRSQSASWAYQNSAAKAASS